jgi:hypothetical protein
MQHSAFIETTDAKNAGTSSMLKSEQDFATGYALACDCWSSAESE